MDYYLSVIIPAFNEEMVIEENLGRVVEFLQGYLGPGKNFELLVVNDGSTDTTPLILRELEGRWPFLRVLHHPRNLGRGQALRTAFENVRGRYLVTLDADLSYSPEHIAVLLPPLENNQADIVLASAFHPQGSVKNVPFTRALTSRLGNRVLSASLNHRVRTLTCVVRSYRREVVDHLELFSSGKDIHLEILLKATLLGFRLLEVPAHLRWRPGKRTSGRKGMTVGDFRGLALNHLFFNFLFSPGKLLAIPIAILLVVILIISTTMVLGYLDVLSQLPDSGGFLATHYEALRTLLLRGEVSFLVLSLALLLLFQFLSLTFLAKQSQHYFNEVFAFLSRLSIRIKRLEGGD